MEGQIIVGLLCRVRAMRDLLDRGKLDEFFDALQAFCLEVEAAVAFGELQQRTRTLSA